jgi:hypothetical protein
LRNAYESRCEQQPFFIKNHSFIQFFFVLHFLFFLSIRHVCTYRRNNRPNKCISFFFSLK